MRIGKPHAFEHKLHVNEKLEWSLQGHETQEMFELLELMGEGTFGKVFRARHKQSHADIAIKVANKTIDPELMQRVQKEIKLLTACSHPNVVHYYGCILSKEQMWIIMDYCGVGSLSDMWVTLGKPLTEGQARYVMSKVMAGVDFIHQAGVLHRDIKAANVLLTEHAEVKITDFGVSTELTMSESEKRSTANIGSPYWMSPQVIAGVPYDHKADIWSCGITAIEFVEGNPPFWDLNPYGAMLAIVQGGRPSLAHPEHCSRDFNHFLMCCFQANPEDVPPASELLSHPWLLRPPSSDCIMSPIKSCLAKRARKLRKEQEKKQEQLDMKTVDLPAPLPSSPLQVRPLRASSIATDRPSIPAVPRLKEREKLKDLKEKIIHKDAEINRLKHINKHLRQTIKDKSNVIFSLQKALDVIAASQPTTPTEKVESTVPFQDEEEQKQPKPGKDLEDELANLEKLVDTIDSTLEPSSDQLQTNGGQIENRVHCEEIGVLESKKGEELLSEDVAHEDVSPRQEVEPGAPATSKKDFDLLAVVGSGRFAKVIQVRKKDSGKIYAMKVLLKKVIFEENQVENIKAENQILRQISHPFIVKLHWAFQSTHKLFLIMDFANGGELFFHLAKGDPFTEERTQFYSAEIVSALGFLHSMDIVYRDLKPENILLDGQGHIVLTDFGLSKQISGRTGTMCGTPYYTAPEMLRQEVYSVEVDWFSMGCLIFEMLTGLPPFYSDNIVQVFNRTISGTVDYPEEMSQSAISFLKGLLAANPKQRLGFGPTGTDDIKTSEFFQGINWEKLESKQSVPPWTPPVKSVSDLTQIDPQFTESELVIKTDLKSPQPANFKGYTFDHLNQPRHLNHRSSPRPSSAPSSLLRQIFKKGQTE